MITSHELFKELLRRRLPVSWEPSRQFIFLNDGSLPANWNTHVVYHDDKLGLFVVEKWVIGKKGKYTLGRWERHEAKTLDEAMETLVGMMDNTKESLIS